MKNAGLLGGLIFLVLVVIILSNRGLAEKKEGSTIITPQEAKERMEQDPSIILVDVRGAEEYQEKHIPHSILIPLDTLEQSASERLPDRSAPIFVYCLSGRRSAAACDLLVKMGYTNIYNLGGLQNWPYPTESSSSSTQ
jgi:rhodanese-related sulfurtransferase